MLDLMHEAPGVGLAAPQVGLPIRLFVANETGEPEDDKVFINPTLRDPSEETEPYSEGCLSLPDITAQITRPIGITIDATDLDGALFSLTSDTLAARIWQHENDHLDGITIIKRMNPMDRLTNQRAIRLLEKS
jgi:peptide deformylase